ncbi:acyltransferase [Gordonia sp. (in: high G+C Gram-positive bacteria)]|uniref:acyltransferase n=1 Tax=unclassified Gordonia (in: high G+C Gram-positive bacteria) TaxID=2657482 RepID=UPI00262C1F37|nr:acyltransferase [Gordonia sp. (in: high G+C Gram-positive bacteria)]
MDSSADTRPEAPAATPQDKPRKKDKHLYQIDFVRLVTFAGVVLDHVILAIAPYTELIAQGVGLLLRYTRYCFFALTGFVLTYQYRHRELHAPTFWRRRFKLIGLPFVTWSLFYWVYNRWRRGGWGDVWAAFDGPHAALTAGKSIAYDLITGHAAYHLYFLSVSMQIYVVFPAVLWVLRRTNGYHRYLLAVSGTFHLWLLYHMVRPALDIFTHGPLGLLWRYLGITLLPYQFFVLAGCLAAFHFEAFSAFMKRWRWPLSVIALITIAATLAYYADQVMGLGGKLTAEDVFRATNVFMVHNAFAFIGIIVLLWTGGVIWQTRRRPGSTADSLMAKAADRSFAIYLAHVVAIFAVTPQFLSAKVGIGWMIVPMYLVVCALTLFLVEVLRLSPISLITTGRNRLDWRKQNPGKQLVVACASIIIGVVIQQTLGYGIGTYLAGTGILLLIGASAVLYKQRTSGMVDAA